MWLVSANIRRVLYGTALMGFCVVGTSGPSFGASGNFVAVINEQNNLDFSDSVRSVIFFDADSPGTGPLFSVFVPFEQLSNFEDPDAISVDPATGNIYVLGFDSGTPGAAPINDPNGYFDRPGDRDLYRINFSDVYDYWATNHEGTNVRSPLVVGGVAPKAATGSQGNLGDYVTYGVTRPILSFSSAHSNTFILPNSIEKIGEINRNPIYAGTMRVNSGTLQIVSHSPLLTVFDQDTLLLLDDALDDSPANDYYYRLIERVSSTPGLATSDNVNGGYNEGTTESWESRRIGQVFLDTDGMNPSTPVDISNPQTIAAYTDPLTGVRGAWVGDRDGGGDDIAFFEINSSGNGIGYRPMQVGPGPDYPTAFALDNDPFTNSNSNDGTIDKVFVDQDTGDLIIVEGSYADPTVGEPGVFRREIETYDNGAGRIDFGAWHEKKILNPQKDAGDTFLERGYWSAYDSVNDRVFFISPGDANEDPLKNFAADIYVLNVNEGCDGSVGGCDESVHGMYGETRSFLNVDESISLFFGTFNANYGDKLVYFSLQTEPILIGDYNKNGVVDTADYTVWRDNVGAATLDNRDPANDGVVGAADYQSWKSNFGEVAAVGSGSTNSATVPEPASCCLVAFGLAFNIGFYAVRRRRPV